MSKRAVIAIRYKNFGKSVLNQQQLFEIYNEDRNFYNILYATGEAKSMSYSFSRELPCVNSDIERNYSGALPVNEDPFCDSVDTLNLLSGIYMAKNKIITSAKLFGSHRHKSVIKFEKHETVEVCGNLSAKEVLLQDMQFLVKSGSRLRIEKAMLDNIQIVVEPEGLLYLDDVEFSGNKTPCIHLKDGSIVQEYKDVRFFDVHKRFIIERADQEFSGKVLDVTSANDILDFLGTSIVKQIELISDIEAPLLDILLKQDIVFSNQTNRKIKFSAKKIETSNNIVFLGDFSVCANVELNNSSNTVCSFSDFNGSLHVEEVSAMKISRTIFNDVNLSSNRDAKQIDISSSSIEFDSCIFTNGYKVLQSASSEIKLNNCVVDKIQELVCAYEKEIDEDSLLLGYNEQGVSLLINNCKIERSQLINTMTVQHIEMYNTSFNNCSVGIVVSGTKTFILDGIVSHNVDNFLLLTNTEALIRNSSLKSGNIAIQINGARVMMENSSVEEYNNAVVVDSGVMSAKYTSIINNQFGITLEGEGCLFEHYSCDVSKNIQRAIFRKPGSGVVDLKEKEEEEMANAV